MRRVNQGPDFCGGKSVKSETWTRQAATHTLRGHLLGRGVLLGVCRSAIVKGDVLLLEVEQ